MVQRELLQENPMNNKVPPRKVVAYVGKYAIGESSFNFAWGLYAYDLKQGGKSAAGLVVKPRKQKRKKAA